MNCDQVFDVLTRGPFPTGTHCDVPVEAHLDACAECRRLAEALRPAIELFQEAVDPEESRDLPGYWCSAANDRQQASVSYIPEVESRPTAPRAMAGAAMVGGWSAVMAWRMAAMLALGVTLGSLASAGWVLDGSAWSGFGSEATVAPLSPRKDEPRLTMAERMELAVLPAACYRRKPADGPRYSLRGDQLLTGADLGNLSCCSGCHNAGSDAVPGVATAKVVQSCQLCHAGQP